MTACPCAQELVAGRARERLLRRGLRRRADRAHPRPPCPSPRTTSAASARCRSAAGRTASTEIDARTLLDDRRGQHVLGDLRADEALRRGRGRRKGPPPPALRRGLRARDGRAASSSASAAATARRFVSARQENLETIHQHNVVAERYGLLGELRARDRDRRAPRAPDVEREWLDAAGALSARYRPVRASWRREPAEEQGHAGERQQPGPGVRPVGSRPLTVRPARASSRT